jgi:hypothetical protein
MTTVRPPSPPDPRLFVEGENKTLYYNDPEIGDLIPVCSSYLRLAATIVNSRDEPLYRLVQFYGRRRGQVRLVILNSMLTTPTELVELLAGAGLRLHRAEQRPELIGLFLQTARAAVFRMTT